MGIVVGAADEMPEGIIDGTCDGTSTSRHKPHDRSLRTLGYIMQVSRQSAVPAVPLYMYQPLVNSMHPSGTALHSPARIGG